MCCPRTTEVTFEGVVTYSCEEGMDGSFPSVSACSKLTFSFVAVVRDAITASGLAEAVITWETVSRSGTAKTSSTARVVGVLRGPVKLIGELTVYTAGEPVVGYPGVCNHEVPLVLGCSRFAPSCSGAASSSGFAGYTAGELVVVFAEVCNHEVPLMMSPVMQATGWRIVLTSSIAPFVVDLHVACERKQHRSRKPDDLLIKVVHVSPITLGTPSLRVRHRTWTSPRAV